MADTRSGAADTGPDPSRLSASSKAPLAGIRVLDMSRVLAGPWCGQLLADLGAEVIKIERPDGGDDTRQWGPPWLESEGGSGGESAYYLSANRGKQSVTVDITRPEGQEVIRTLAADCDVVIENFKAGGLARYGLDHASLRRLYPSLIYCSITGFGQTGPYAHRAGYDLMIQAMGGLMSLTGQPDGTPGGGPVKVGVALTDIFTGVYASSAILAALHGRHHHGLGTHIDLALMDVQVSVLANQALNYLTSGKVPERLGNAHPSIVPYQAFATADGHLVVAVGNDAQFGRFCEALGVAELAVDPRFATNTARVQHREALNTHLAEALGRQSTAHWLTALEAVSVPAGPINALDEVFRDPHVKARGLLHRLDHPDAKAGKVDLVASPIHFDGQPLTSPIPPPTLGQHTDSVLRTRLGLTDKQIEGLKALGVL